jgi:hypothetical protein
VGLKKGHAGRGHAAPGLNGEKRCSIAVESTSARRGELFAELRHRERAQRASLKLGHDPAQIHVRRKLDLIRFDWPPRRGPRFRMQRSFAEAAQVLSWHLTEPMRGSRRRPQLAPLSMRRSLAVSRSRQDRGGDHVYPISPLVTPPLAQRASCRGGGSREGSSSPYCMACTWHGEVSGAQSSRKARRNGMAVPRSRSRCRWSCPRRAKRAVVARERVMA